MIRTLCLAAIVFVAVASFAADAPPDPQSRVAIKLHRGVNLSHWFAQAERYKHDANYHTPEHFKLIKSLGLDHVRLSIDPEPLWDAAGRKLQAEHLAKLDAAVKMIREAGLAVVIDIHPDDDFKAAIEKDEAKLADFAELWSRLAGHFASQDPRAAGVCFELINEPRVVDADKWAAMQGRLHAAVRAAAPRHTIVLTGPEWSSVDMLLKIKPVDDANVLYTFHFYEPFHFTHQGSTWTTDWLRKMHGLPYPSSPEAVEPALAGIPDGEPRNNARWYGEQRWDRAKVAGQFALVAEWAKKHDAAIYLGEFGVLRTHSPADSRMRWHRDVRELAEEHGWPWCLWDFSDVFGLATRGKDGTITPDGPIIEALRLKP